MVRVEFSKAHSAPNILNSSIKVLVSRKLGTFFITVIPSASSDEAIIGKTAFFAPEILTLPLKALPPFTTNLSMRPCI